MKDRFLQFLSIIKKSGNLLEGYNKCEEAIKKSRNKVKLCILSIDVALNTKEKFERICEKNQIQLIQVCTKQELGNTLGREEINVLCITNLEMSKKLLELSDSEQIKRG